MKATFDDPEEAILDAIAPLLNEASQREEADRLHCIAVRVHVTANDTRPFDLPLSILVCTVHNRWQEHYAAAKEWKAMYDEKAEPLRKEHASLPKGERIRRRELKAGIERLEEIGTLGRTCVYAEFGQSQHALQAAAKARATQLLAQREPKLTGRKLENAIDDALIHFNELWSERCYLEMTWKWTLEKCLQTALFGPA